MKCQKYVYEMLIPFCLFLSPLIVDYQLDPSHALLLSLVFSLSQGDVAKWSIKNKIYVMAKQY